jgi:hypothetical protein
VPGGIRGQIDGSPFVVAIPKPAETAQEIAQVDEGDESYSTGCTPSQGSLVARNDPRAGDQSSRG